MSPASPPAVSACPRRVPRVPHTGHRSHNTGAPVRPPHTLTWKRKAGALVLVFLSSSSDLDQWKERHCSRPCGKGTAAVSLG